MKNNIIEFEKFEKKLININNNLVLLDKDVADLYGIKPYRLKEQLKRNLEKFPKDYAYQVTNKQIETMVSQNAIPPSKSQFGGYNPWVFTEKGLYMVATILKSEKATQATFTIIETFSKIRELNRNINTIINIEDEEKQKGLMERSNKILGNVLDIVFEDDNDDRDVLEEEIKVELNLGVYKRTKTTKKKKIKKANC